MNKYSWQLLIAITLNLLRYVAVGSEHLVTKLKTSQTTWNTLDKQFPKSNRVRRLKGMLLEAQGKWGQADSLYREILVADPTDSVSNLIALLSHFLFHLSPHSFLSAWRLYF